MPARVVHRHRISLSPNGALHRAGSFRVGILPFVVKERHLREDYLPAALVEDFRQQGIRVGGRSRIILILITAVAHIVKGFDSFRNIGRGLAQGGFRLGQPHFRHVNAGVVDARP